MITTGVVTGALAALKSGAKIAKSAEKIVGTIKNTPDTDQQSKNKKLKIGLGIGAAAAAIAGVTFFYIKNKK